MIDEKEEKIDTEITWTHQEIYDEVQEKNFLQTAFHIVKLRME